jgi:Protein of unknown function (DUF1571)
MKVRPTGLRRRRQIMSHGLPRWLFLCLVASLTAPIEAYEQGESPNATTTKPAEAAAVRSAARTAQQSAADRVASVDRAPKTRLALKPGATMITDRAGTPTSESSSIDRALRSIAECQARYQAIDDYTCTFYKRERIAGRTTPQYIMAMKVRTKPASIYFKFHRPAQGREAIYIAGRHGGKVLAHDVGLNKVLAGTLQLEPTSSRAMEDCRHPITEAGIGPLLDTLAKRWAAELDPEESKLTFNEDMVVGPARCTMIESTHPKRRPEFLHFRVRVFIDQDLGLPIRFEAYDWPKRPHSEPELLEEYTYMHLKLNVGLHDIDFDASNAEYSFGRF